MSDLQCTGKETLITDCPSSGWRNVVDEDCLDHSHDAGVLCYGSGKHIQWLLYWRAAMFSHINLLIFEYLSPKKDLLVLLSRKQKPNLQCVHVL